MKNNNYEFLFLKDKNGVKNKKDLIEYEKLLFDYFQENQWIMQNYKIVDGNRLQPTVNYNDVVILIIKKDNRIISGISGNINSNSYFQAEQLGFKLENKLNACEGLNFFIVKEYSNNILKIIGLFFDFMINSLSKTNINQIYLTCKEKHVNIYEILGFKTIDSLIVNTNKRYLLRIDF